MDLRHVFGCPVTTPVYLGISLPACASCKEIGSHFLLQSWELPSALFSPPLADTVWTRDLGRDHWMLKTGARRSNTNVTCGRHGDGGADIQILIQRGWRWCQWAALIIPEIWASWAPPAQPPNFQVQFCNLPVPSVSYPICCNELLCLWSIPKNLAFPFHPFE